MVTELKSSPLYKALLCDLCAGLFLIDNIYDDDTQKERPRPQENINYRNHNYFGARGYSYSCYFLFSQGAANNRTDIGKASKPIYENIR